MSVGSISIFDASLAASCNKLLGCVSHPVGRREMVALLRFHIPCTFTFGLTSYTEIDGNEVSVEEGAYSCLCVVDQPFFLCLTIFDINTEVAS